MRRSRSLKARRQRVSGVGSGAVMRGSPRGAAGAPADFLIEWAQTDYLVKGVRIYVDTDASTEWEQIDAIQLHGMPGPYGQWADSVSQTRSVKRQRPSGQATRRSR